MTKKYAFSPDYAVPPGATLKETLEVKGMSQADLASRTGMAEKTISQIVNGIAPITYETAEKLELVLGIPSHFWNARERSYRQALIRIQDNERLATEVEWLKELPLKVLTDKGLIKEDNDKSSVVRQVLRFFGVSNVPAWREVWERPCVQYRGGQSQKRHPGWVAVWLRLGELAAEAVTCQPYSPQIFRETLTELRSLTTGSIKTWWREAKAKCAAAGVAAVMVKEIPGAGIFGVAKWLTKDKALIQLSLKYKTDDQLVFSFFHEAGHIVLHGKRRVFVEYGQCQDVEEREADGFAADFLIPDDHTRALQYLKNESAIISFARTIGVPPGVVVSRMQHDGLMPPTHCNHLKRKVDWE